MDKALLLLALLTFALLVSCKKGEEVSADSSRAVKQESASQSSQIPEKAPEQSGSQGDPPASPNFEMQPYLENPDAVTLGPTMDPASVEAPAQPGYLVAQEKPKLLAQLPCFCYCNRFGHTSLHDCFTTNHAELCDVCLKEAVEADQMNRGGLTVQEIRSMI